MKADGEINMELQQRRNRGASLTPVGILRVIEVLETKCWSREDLAIKIAKNGKDALDTVNRLLSGKKVEKTTLRRIASLLGLSLEEITLPLDWVSVHPASLPWREIAWEYFNRSEPLTINSLVPNTFSDQKLLGSFPLNLARRDSSSQSDRSKSPHHIGFQPASKTCSGTTYLFSSATFFEEVIAPYLKKSQQTRILLTGDPGAGKTALLRKLAEQVFQQKDWGIVIWISLADLLESPEIENYVFLTWVQKALRIGVKPDEAQQRSLEALFNQGKVWLFIDGLDEVESMSGLLSIRKALLEGVLGKAHWVFSCRTHWWESLANPMRKLDMQVYEVLPLKSGSGDQLEDVGVWIDGYASSPDAAQILKNQLRVSENSFLREMVSNPLLLVLLCLSHQEWHSFGGLPKIRFQLFVGFVHYLYGCKPHLGLIKDWKKRNCLEQALSVLAFTAFDTLCSPYRLTSQFIENVWEKENFDPSLLALIKAVGFLKQSKMGQTKPHEQVYLFPHPSFQEFFAALAVVNRPVLLNPDRSNPTALSATYWLLEARWLGVYLFMLGRDDSIDPSLKQKKEAIVEALTSFDQSCGGFYHRHAYYLAAIGLKEFPASQQAPKIISQLIRWIILPDEPSDFFETSSIGFTERQMAIQALQQTDPAHAIKILEQQLQNSQGDELLQCQLAELLGLFAHSRSFAISELSKLLRSDRLDVQCHAASALCYLNPAREDSVETLRRILATSKDDVLCLKAASALMRMSPDDCASSIEVVTRVSRISSNSLVRSAAYEMLMPIQKIVAKELKLSEFLEQEGLIDSGSDTLSISALLEQSSNFIDTANKLADALLEADNLPELLSDASLATRIVQALKKVFVLPHDTYTWRSNSNYEALYRCARIIPYPVFHRAWYEAEGL